ncbi:MAG: ORF6N domain-containing protein [Acidithiobacillus sp.]
MLIVDPGKGVPDVLASVESPKMDIAGQNMRVVEYLGRRVVTFAMIDRLHQRAVGTAIRNFRANKRRLKEGKDYFYITDSKSLDEFRQSGILASAANEITFLSESGYLLLVKSFSDDLAWEVQRELVDGYFRSAAIGRGVSAALPDLKAVPLLCHELDRVGLAVSAIAAASLQYAQNPGKSWGTLAERLNLPAESVAESQDGMKARIWRSLCDLGGTDVPERIPRGALPRIWALLNHMNRFYSGGRERIGGKRQVVAPRSLLVGPPKPVSTLDGISLRQAFSKQTALHLESQLGDIPVSELLAYDRSFLRRLPNIGEKKVDEVERFFAGYGLRLGRLPDKPALS